MVQCGAKSIRARAVAAVSSSLSSSIAPPDGSFCCGSSSTGRRQFLYMSLVPFLVKDVEVPANANAADSSANEVSYLKEEIRMALSKGKAAGVLRLVFHDAGTFDINEKTGGMNGSIVLELGRPENKGLKKSVKASCALSFVTHSLPLSSYFLCTYFIF